MIKDQDIIKLQGLKDALEDDSNTRRNTKKRIKNELNDNESFEDLNQYRTGDENAMPVKNEKPEVIISMESKAKTTKQRQSTEDKLKGLLDEQYMRISTLIDEKLDNYNYRMYNSFKAEFRRWHEGYYDQFK